MLPVLIHGDAAFAGQGVVAETLQPVPAARATAPAARCTSSSTTRSASPPARPTRARRTYSTDVAKMVQAPIFHVNGDDPEAAVRVIAPGAGLPPARSSATSSSTWSATAAAATTRATSRPTPTRCSTRRSSSTARSASSTPSSCCAAATSTSRPPSRRWRTSASACARSTTRCAGASRRDDAELADDAGGASRGRRRTTAGRPASRRTARAASSTACDRRPEGFDVAPEAGTAAGAGAATRSTTRQDRLGAGRGAGLRLAGAGGHPGPAQRRGQRARHLQPAPRRRCTTTETGEPYVPLATSRRDQAPFNVFDSLLSEFAVLGFEYGYSVESPRARWCCGRRSSATSSTAPR